jgi:hypothetical protein
MWVPLLPGKRSVVAFVVLVGLLSARQEAFGQG